MRLKININVLDRGDLCGPKDCHWLCSEAVIHGDQTIILQPDGQQVSYDGPKPSLWSGLWEHMSEVWWNSRTEEDDGRRLGFPFFIWVKFLQIYAKALTHPHFVPFHSAESNVKFVF